MGYRFPDRSPESDDAAFLVKSTLDRYQPAQGFMVSVVTNCVGKIFVGISGNREPVAAALRSRLNLSQQDLTSPRIRELQQKVSAWKAQLDAEHRRMSTHHPLSMEAQLAGFGAERIRRRRGDITRETIELLEEFIASRRREAPAAAHTVHTGQTGLQRLFGPPLDGGNWNCSEPKALLEAALDGGGLTGMTTIWYGSEEAQEFKDYAQVDARRRFSPEAAMRLSPEDKIPFKVPLLAARPCARCRLNEVRIMTVVRNFETIQRGGMFLWHESPF